MSPFNYVKYNYSFDVSFLLLENMLEAESPLRDQLGNVFPPQSNNLNLKKSK